MLLSDHNEVTDAGRLISVHSPISATLISPWTFPDVNSISQCAGQASHHAHGLTRPTQAILFQATVAPGPTHVAVEHEPPTCLDVTWPVRHSRRSTCMYSNQSAPARQGFAVRRAREVVQRQPATFLGMFATLYPRKNSEVNSARPRAVHAPVPCQPLERLPFNEGPQLGELTYLFSKVP